MPDIVSFIFWKLYLFCIPVNIELCSGLQFNYMILLSVAFKVFRATFSLRLIISYYWGKILLNLLIKVSWIVGLSSLVGENWHCSRLLCLQSTDPSSAFKWFFPWPPVISSHIYLPISTLLHTQGWHSAYFQNFLSVSSLLSGTLSSKQ